MYTEIHSTTAREQSLIYSAARGCYQHALLRGYEAWSGATLRGTARSYGYWYARSRANLIARIARLEGVTIREERRAHGKRVVVITGTLRALAIA